MTELIVAGIGLAVCGAVAAGAVIYANEGDGLGILLAIPIGFASAVIGVYFLIRLIHWAWETPIPMT